MPSSVIQALSPLTIQKIAAGEVIERPASVVKELVENALDAGATKITVTLEDGGKERIRVADNGLGMTLEDLQRCWLPHTTSKIRAVEDLDHVLSFGFRGEALASMAAVSECTIETRHWEESVGHRLRVVESVVDAASPEECARAQGTTITVANLFRNNPVRRKFLGTARAESGRVTTLLTRLSLAHPGVSFRLSEGPSGAAREVLHLPEGTLRRRAGDVLGVHVLEDLVEVDWEGGGIHVQGYVSEPQRFAGRPGRQHFFVNRRNVQNPLLTRALMQAYGVVPPGRHPVSALFVTIAPDAIDVNVHPTKREIRFLNEGQLFWALSQALQTALRGAIDAPSLDLNAPLAHPSDGGAAGGFAPSAPLAAEPGAASSPDSPSSFPPPFRYTDSDPEDAHASRPDKGGSRDAATAVASSGVPAADPAVTDTSKLALFPETRRAHHVPDAPEFTGAPCLQLHGSFIVTAVRGGYLLVNQRAAHERILYEKALEDLRRPGRLCPQPGPPGRRTRRV